MSSGPVLCQTRKSDQPPGPSPRGHTLDTKVRCEVDVGTPRSDSSGIHRAGPLGDSGCPECQDRSGHDPSHLSLAPFEPRPDLEEGLQRVVPEDGHGSHSYSLRAVGCGAGRSRGMETRRRGRTAAQRPSPARSLRSGALRASAPRPHPARSPRARSERFRITSKNLIRTLLGRQPVRGKIYGFEVCRYPIIKE